MGPGKIKSFEDKIQSNFIETITLKKMDNIKISLFSYSQIKLLKKKALITQQEWVLKVLV